MHAKLSRGEVLATVSEQAGVPKRLVTIVVDQFASHPDEIAALVADNERAEREMALAVARRSHRPGT